MARLVAFLRAVAGWYFGPCPFESRGAGRVYEIVGVHFYKRLLRTSGNPRGRWPARAALHGRRARLEACLRTHLQFTREYEVRHLVGGALMQTAGMAVIFGTGHGSFAALTIANVIINGYPVLLQRYNRVRLQAALARVGGEGRRPPNLPLQPTSGAAREQLSINRNAARG
ncbi:MAG: hypothetical protein K6T59_12570 [Bryobacteraceae bacterium]|nr:hypothetical protein [Bryobacteraceae bacterium]